MNPDSNRFEPLTILSEKHIKRNTSKEQRRRLNQIARKEIDPSLLNILLRPNGEPVPNHWSTFTVGEHVVIKNYTFKVVYVGETSILFEPVGPEVIDPTQ